MVCAEGASGGVWAEGCRQRVQAAHVATLHVTSAPMDDNRRQPLSPLRRRLSPLLTRGPRGSCPASLHPAPPPPPSASHQPETPATPPPGPRAAGALGSPGAPRWPDGSCGASRTTGPANDGWQVGVGKAEMQSLINSVNTVKQPPLCTAALTPALICMFLSRIHTISYIIARPRLQRLLQGRTARFGCRLVRGAVVTHEVQQAPRSRFGVQSRGLLLERLASRGLRHAHTRQPLEFPARASEGPARIGGQRTGRE